MKHLKSLTTLSLIIISLTMTACASKLPNSNQKNLDSLNKIASNIDNTNNPNNTEINTLTNNTVKTIDASIADNAFDTPKPSILYFDFDSYTMRSDDMPILQKHHQFLQKNSKQILIIQGHTDSRGSSEYNVALGQKRGESVKRSLSLLGITSNPIEVVSFGKEKLLNNAQSEADHQFNRRAEFVYPK